MIQQLISGASQDSNSGLSVLSRKDTKIHFLSVNTEAFTHSSGCRALCEALELEL